MTFDNLPSEVQAVFEAAERLIGYIDYHNKNLNNTQIALVNALDDACRIAKCCLD